MSGSGQPIQTYGTGYTPFTKSGDNTGNGNYPTEEPPPLGPTYRTSPTQTYSAQTPYTTPTFGYTPYSQWGGLAQQIQASMNPQLKAFAAPRTGLSDMAYAPWSMLYGGPSGVPFPGSLPPPGTTPPGTTPPGGAGTGTSTGGAGGYNGNGGTQTDNNGTNAGGIPATQGPPPPTQVPGGYPPPPVGTGTKDMPPPVDPEAVRRHRVPGFNAGLGLRDTTQDTSPYSGINWGGGSPPGGLLNAMNDAGLNINQTGAARLLMSAGRQGQFGGTLSNDQLIGATKQGLAPDEMIRGSFKNGTWLDANGNPMKSRGNTFNYHNKRK